MSGRSGLTPDFHLQACPACGSDRIEDYLKRPLTTFFFPVPPEMIGKIGKEPITLGMCDDCSHIFQREISLVLLSRIYNELYVHYNLDTSEQFQRVYRERTIDFLDGVINNGLAGIALDIGCGEGTYFPFLEGRGFECFGIEPSDKGQIAAEKNQEATVWVGSFETCDEGAFRQPFDVILMNWVLEHIVDLDAFFDLLASCLKPGTRLAIQVPDIAYSLDNDIALFYLHEHVNYFTPQTLRVLLERKGFKIVGEQHGDRPSILMCGEYVGAGSREAVHLGDQVEMKKRFLASSEILKGKISETFSGYDKIVLYGVGLLAFWISEVCLDDSDLEKVELLDDNEYYAGKMVPSFNKPLSAFPEGFVMDDALIFISTSPVYHDAIRERIRSRFRGSYSIATIDQGEVVVESSER